MLADTLAPANQVLANSSGEFIPTPPPPTISVNVGGETFQFAYKENYSVSFVSPGGQRKKSERKTEDWQSFGSRARVD